MARKTMLEAWEFLVIYTAFSTSMAFHQKAGSIRQGALAASLPPRPLPCPPVARAQSLEYQVSPTSILRCQTRGL